jgi:hypothetical protein
MNIKIYFGLWAICSFSGCLQFAFAEDSYKFTGDLRYRFQTIREQEKVQRTQQRLQAKLNLEAKPQQDLNIYFQMLTATGSTSGNQTLGDADAPGMPRRSFGLNWAYFDTIPYEKVHVLGGKMPIPFSFISKHQMILDKDIAPEGLAIKSQWELGSDFNLNVNIANFQIKEQYDTINSKDITDNQLNGLQAKLDYKFDIYLLSLNFGSYSFINFRDNPPGITGNAGKSNTDSHNNTLDLSGNFPTNFDLKDQGIELKSNFGSEWGTLGIGYSVVKNDDVNDLNQAKLVGINYQVGMWSLGWQQLNIQKDAVVGAYTDSDFNNGNTSSKGNILTFGYKINKNSQVSYTQYDCLGQVDTDSPRSYYRSHFDYSVNF